MTATRTKPTLIRIALPLIAALALTGGAFAQEPTTTSGAAPMTTGSTSGTDVNGATTNGGAIDLNAPNAATNSATNGTANDPTLGGSTNGAVPPANDVTNTGTANAPTDANLSTNGAPVPDANVPSTTTPEPTTPAPTSTIVTTPATEEAAPSNLPLILGAVVAVLVIAAIVFFALKGRRSGQIIAASSDSTKK